MLQALHRVRCRVALGSLCLAVSVGAACGDEPGNPTGTGSTSTSSGTTTSTASTGGSGGGGGAQDTSVSGKVVDIEEQPVAGDTVIIGGVAVTTDATGAFSFPDVARPYDLRVVDTASGVTDYLELTTAHPVAQLRRNFVSHDGFASVNGTVSGATVPLMGHDREILLMSSPLASSFDNFQGTGTGDSFHFDMDLFAPPTNFHILAFTWQEDLTTHEPTSFLEFGSLDLSAQSGDVLTPTVDLAPVQTGHLVVDITPQGQQTFKGFGAFLTLGQGFVFLPSQGYPSQPLDIPTPIVPGATSGVVGYFDEGAGPEKTETLSFIQQLPLDGSASLASPATTHLTLPIDAHHGSIVGAELSWSAPTGQVNVVRLSVGTTLVYSAVTTKSSVTIPDLSSLGITFKAGDTVKWNVFGYGPYATIDAAAERGAIYREERSIYKAAGRGPVFADGFTSTPTERTFVVE